MPNLPDFNADRFPLGSGINGNYEISYLVFFYCRVKTASLWEVELMETMSGADRQLVKLLDRFPLGSGINGNILAFSDRTKGIPRPLPSGKWN